MTALFVFSIVLLFATVLAFETARLAGAPTLRQSGLIRWLLSENWPAKIGALLIVIGVGALLRYALLHFAAPNHLKLLGGLGLAGISGAASYTLRADPQRRALHSALAGAAFGISYLCAYAASNLFAYVDAASGVALLFAVAVLAAVYAAQSRAVSVAVLSLAGAYLAPAFAPTPQGPLAVFGYYALVSGLVGVLVRRYAWRALIHLSFVFTLGGGLFLGWTRAFYRPEHFATMLPLLLLLSAIHLALPLAEQRALRGRWLVRLDAVYRLALPLAAGLSIFAIAPGVDPHAALGLALLGVCWLLAAAATRRLGEAGAGPLAVIGALMLGAAVLIHWLGMPELPQLTNAALILATLACVMSGGGGQRRQAGIVGVVFLLLLSGAWAVPGATPAWVFGLATGTALVLLLAFARRLSGDEAVRAAFPVEAWALPLALLVWAPAVAQAAAWPVGNFTSSAVAGGLLLMLGLAQGSGWRHAAFHGGLLGVAFLFYALLLLVAFTAHIERGAWPVASELLGLALLAAVAFDLGDRATARLPLLVLAVLLALMLQAQVLRLFGPPGRLTMVDIARVGLPAVISLLWASIGAMLAGASQRLASRPLWTAGAALLAVSAVKLIVFDFAALGELENIVALLAAGGVFLLVAWRAPVPPATAAGSGIAPENLQTPADEAKVARAPDRSSPR